MRSFVSLDDRINAPIAGFISALSVSFESNSRKSLFTILVLSRCVDSLLNLLEEEGYISKNRNLRFFLIWFFAHVFLTTMHVVRPEIVNRGFLKFYYKWAMRSHNEKV
jgi:hypothetical protein